MYLSKPEQEQVRSWCKDEASYEQMLAFLNRKSSLEEQILDQLATPLVLVDAKADEHPIVFVNQAFESFTGYQRRDILGKNPRFLQEADRKQPELDKVRAAIRNESNVVATLRNYRPDGTLFWNRMSMMPVHDESGQLTHFMSSHVDVTAEMETGDNTLLFDRVYSYFIENTADMISIHAPDGTLLYINPAVTDTLGYSFAEMQVMTQEIWMHLDEAVPPLNRALHDVLAGKTVSRIEYRLQKKDAETIWIEAYASPIYAEDGTLTHILVISRDATERVLRSEKQFRTLVENNPDRIQRVDYNGRFLYVNPALAKAWAMSADDIIGKTNTELGVPDDLAQELEQARHGVFETGEVTDIEFSHDRGDGLRHFQARLVPEFNAEGQVETLLSIVRDITETRQSALALEKSEALLKKAQEVGGIGSWEVNLSTGKAVWSDEFYRLCGYEPQSVEPSVEFGLSIIHPDDIEITIKTLEKSQTERVPYHFEQRVVHPDGSLHWLEARGEVITDENGVDKLVGTCLDITHRKNAELALQESEARANALLNAIPDMVFRIDRDGYYLDFHADESQLVKNPPVIGQHVIERTGEESGRVILGKIKDTLTSNELQTYEQTVTTVSGQSRVFESRFVPVGEDEVIVVVRDMTREKQAHLALQASEARANALLDAIPDLVFRLSRTGEYLDFHGNRDSLQVDEQQLIGTNIADYFDADLNSKILEAIARALDSGELQTVEYKLELDDGKSTEHEARLLASGKEEVIAIVRDITYERMVQEQQLSFAIEQERTAILSQFIQMAAHEFRTPLSVITTNLHMLTKLQDEERRKQKVERIQKHILQLNHLVEMQLLMTKLDSGVAIKRETTMLEKLINHVLVTLSDKIDLHNIQVQVEIQPETMTITADAGYFQEALSQLVDNAIRYSPDGATVNIRARQTDEQVEISIADEGTGITADEKEHIFERFWRKDKAQSEAGLGLGLPLAQKVVELHDGAINVCSEAGQGSTFTVRLPRL